MTTTRRATDELVAVGPGRPTDEPTSPLVDRRAGDSVREPSSYRDPAGFVFRRDGVLYRQINASFADRWADLTASGLLDRLQTGGILIDHEVAPLELAQDPSTAIAVIRPTPVEVVSYPYEWS